MDTETTDETYEGIVDFTASHAVISVAVDRLLSVATELDADRPEVAASVREAIKMLTQGYQSFISDLDKVISFWSISQKVRE